MKEQKKGKISDVGIIDVDKKILRLQQPQQVVVLLRNII